MDHDVENDEILQRGGVTLWRQLADRLRHEVDQGLLSPAEKLPSEFALARRFGVNRHTVRQAIRHLTAEGIVHAEQGRGTFVSDKVLEYPLGQRPRFSAGLAAQDRAPGREIVATEVTRDAEIATTLGLTASSDLIAVLVVGFADRLPVLTGTSYLPALRFAEAPERLQAEPSFTSLFAGYGIINYRRKWTRIQARMPTSIEARRLQQRVAAPVLVTEALDIDESGRAISWATVAWASERVSLFLEDEASA